MQAIFCTAPTKQKCTCYICDKEWEEPGDYDYREDRYVFVPVSSDTECPECRNENQ